MKSKLRKIVVDEHEYLYNIGEKWHEDSEITKVSLKVYLNGFRNTPVFIDFTVYIDYFGGLPLNHGVKLLNKESDKEDLLNINEPGLVRKIIVLARGRGWNGNNRVDNQNGNDYLRELGYDISEIIG